MRKHTVLVVDDDRIIREQLEIELKRIFYETRTAENAKDTINIFKSEKIDILLLDVNLPDGNGLDILTSCKETNPHCEVIVITGVGTQEIAIQSLRKGAIDYIEKPIQSEELTAALGRASEKISNKDELLYKNTLLVIDDEEQIATRLKRFFEKEGYEVYTAFNGTDAINIVSNNKIDVIISDVKMRDISGIEVLSRAKQLHSYIEGIMITGSLEQDIAIKALRAGAADYITKPVNLEELLFSVKRAIERINLNRTRLYRCRELQISTEIIAKMNEELERRISERTQELNRTQSQLFQTSKLATLGEMAAGLAHEMNQPLGGISLVAKSMRKFMEKGMLDNNEINKGLTDIDESVKRMVKIIQHIRTFARQDTLKFIKVNVNETIDYALSLLNAQLRLHEIEIIKYLQEDLPNIVGEPYQLEQVWINLITNARDAIQEREKRITEADLSLSGFNKSITIKTQFIPDTDNIEVSFIDTGIGISNEIRHRVLEPFFTTKEVGKATGLGLSISYGIIENHHGSIEIRSALDEGATIKIILPIGEQ